MVPSFRLTSHRFNSTKGHLSNCIKKQMRIVEVCHICLQCGQKSRARPISTIDHDARPMVLASGSPYSDLKTTKMASISTAHNMAVLCAGAHEVRS